ncbi:sulfate transporter CysZ [Glaciecola sp. 1036]|uniref:sulfate transporter CysZ n=1 Tax=Alteromonadaceae TaxID=72275 RepID=UPI003CFE6101
MQQTSGARYFLNGFQLIKTKGIKRFVFIPFFVNILLFSVAFYFLLDYIQAGVDYVVNLVPDFLGWLKDAIAYVLWPLAVISVLLVFALIFGTLANWIAAPFNGLLSEKIERHLRGESIGDEGWFAVIKDIPRTLGREAAKLLYFLPRALVFLIAFFLLPVIGQIIWFLFSAWMMAIQYCDYPFDNHKIGFKPMRMQLRGKLGNSMSFGIMVNLFSLIPIVNFIVMPVAICGATQMWVEQLREQALQDKMNQVRK